MSNGMPWWIAVPLVLWVTILGPRLIGRQIRRRLSLDSHYRPTTTPARTPSPDQANPGATDD